MNIKKTLYNYVISSLTFFILFYHNVDITWHILSMVKHINYESTLWIADFVGDDDIVYRFRLPCILR